MARLNVSSKRTHEGGVAARFQDPLAELRRAVSSCMLWEGTFYETGGEIAERIKRLCRKVDPEKIVELALHARHGLGLRHVPLLLLRQLALVARGRMVGDAIAQVISRPDELAEFLAVYWSDNGKKTLSKQVKRGLAKAFAKFDAYQLAKYNRRGDVRLRDVMFLTHPKPGSEEQAEVWRRLANGDLGSPDTWEVRLSGGGDKKAVFTELLEHNRLGSLALLRNLRLMYSVGVDANLIRNALERASFKGVLPTQFVAAWRAAPEEFHGVLEDAMLRSMGSLYRLRGKTVVVVDVSGSMESRMSKHSSVSRVDAAAALVLLMTGSCTGGLKVYTFSDKLVEVPVRSGFSLVDDIVWSQEHGGTHLGRALKKLYSVLGEELPARMVVITDEQVHDELPPARVKYSYLVNVAPYQPGLDTDKTGWTRINGFSERLVDWIYLNEGEEQPDVTLKGVWYG